MASKRSHSYEVDGIDDATAALVLQLQADDLEEVLRLEKGKYVDGQLPDHQLALQTYQEELKARSVVHTDRCMAQSHTQAVMSDAELIGGLVEVERVIICDRALAQSIEGTAATLAPPYLAPTGVALNEGALERLAHLYVPPQKDESTSSNSCDEEEAESSVGAALRPRKKHAIHRECMACVSEKPIFDIYQAPCGHYYCKSCLAKHFEVSTTDESRFPPHCCGQRIPMETARIYLDSSLVREFELKSTEFKTSGRTYCSDPTCQAFIRPASIVSDKAECTTCGTQTCTICKSLSHNGDCPQDTATQQVQALAEQQGWRKCYKNVIFVSADNISAAGVARNFGIYKSYFRVQDLTDVV
ncbi:uncharacterized protein KY384_001292 [Bacidia gigantensis]|uniref:uncharacterized protein n=1 Tax=Bacidia gigantensis TaxID=2732470 RepID=UPI001D03C6EB|nr:uncharacterized protein KY384_001292 [Bacidia gigantensis]KAG8533552.1 hypothetical protein KY384_001292 [Bacidia gigantensis]